jgi:hypothetical protein
VVIGLSAYWHHPFSLPERVAKTPWPDPDRSEKPRADRD